MKLHEVTASHVRISFEGMQGTYSIPHAEPGLSDGDIPEFVTPREAWEYFNPPPPPAAPPSPEEALQAAKRSAKDELKDWREAALAAGFEFAGKGFQTRHAADRINIMGVGTAAQAAIAAGQPFEVNFRATDNSVVTMDGPTAVSFYQTMVQSAQAIWYEYNTRYEAVEDAATIADVEAAI